MVRDKADQLELTGRLLLLEQDLCSLDLYGTVRGAVSTFDTFNHLPQLDAAIANAGFFMEKGGVLLFDMNTPYKHREVLGNNTFTFEGEDAGCVWTNVWRTEAAAFASRWTLTTARPASVSTRNFVSIHMSWPRSAPHWSGTALRWSPSATARPSVR